MANRAMTELDRALYDRVVMNVTDADWRLAELLMRAAFDGSTQPLPSEVGSLYVRQAYCLNRHFKQELKGRVNGYVEPTNDHGH